MKAGVVELFKVPVLICQFFFVDVLLEMTGEEVELPSKPAPNLIMSYLKIDSPERYLLHVVSSVKSSELEEALLIMPFNLAVKMLEYIDGM